MKRAFDLGINFFDNAEVYADGASEMLMGEALSLFRREDLVLSTKIFWGGKGVNDIGLSWKHLVEGTKRSLKRLCVDYVDLLFCHRPDPHVPIEETVRAMNYLIQAGFIFYWGTSEWSREEIEQAWAVAEKHNLIGPYMEQPQYNLFHRDRVEKEYAPLYSTYGTGTTIWSPLDSGILTGKYNEGIPQGSRLHQQQWLQKQLTPEKIAKVKKITEVARSLDMTCAQLAIAWCLKNKNVSSVILGATSTAQLEQNVKASELKQKLTQQVMDQLAAII
jgi:voltage-dependent potassium channel beta subunit